MYIGIFSPLTLFTAYEPKNTPVLSLSTDSRSTSEACLALLTYSDTSSRISEVVNSSTRACSGAKTKNVTPNIYSYHLVKRILEFLRGVPEIIFAILFVWALGVGPLAGIIAITIHTTGALGKLFSEVHENADLKTCEAIRSHGGNWVSEMRYGIIPKVLPNIISYALLRFEINIRASTVIGFVGAGGIGQELYLVINFNYYEEVSAIILLIILTVITIDISSGRIRQKIIGEMGV